MSSKRTAKGVVWARRLVQAACLCLFLWLLWAAHLTEGVPASPRWRLFFDLDPLVTLTALISAHAVPVVPVLALITIAGTILMGRVFCGWVCPLGTVHAATSWFRRFARKRLPYREAWSKGHRAKYYLLAVLLVAGLFGANWFGVFDPIPLLYRTVATALFPGFQYTVQDGANLVYDRDPHVGPLHVTSVTEPVYQFLRAHVFPKEKRGFTRADLILLVFALIVVLNFYRTRFWCRYVCPLGGLLGLCSQRPALRLVNQPGCTDCGLCARQCPAAANPDKPGDWRPTECFGCWNCVAACNRDAITFKLKSPLPAPSEAKLDLSKRALISAGVGGATGLVLFRLSPQAQGRIFEPSLIRPPGSREEREFLQRCIKCGLCMKVCPTNGLQPAMLESGLEGLWTPVMIPRIGYCEYNCNLCGQVCPTQAIQTVPLEEKKKLKLGLATLDTTRCLPYAYGRECMVCEEHCPTPTKSIFFMPQEITWRDGSKTVLKQPHVDPDICTGCGICEFVCVFKDRAAIRVTSANESRHSGNRPILPGVRPIAPAPQAPAQDNPYG